MNPIKPVEHAVEDVGHVTLNVLINVDRAVASGFGAPEEETISGEIGKHAPTNRIARLAEIALDAIQSKHCENAESLAVYLQEAEAEWYRQHPNE